MTKAIAAALMVLALLLVLPLGAAVVVSMGVGAATECVTPPDGTPPVIAASGDEPDARATPPTNACLATNTVVTVATFNLLGAGHTDDAPGGGSTKGGFPGWEERLPGAIAALDAAAVDIAALQEVHAPQAMALAQQYADDWGMFPVRGNAQNRVIWDRSAWTLTAARLVDVPYFGSTDVGTPLVELTSVSTGESIWMWSIHNPADTRGDAAALRAEALRRQRATLAELAAAGTPAVIAGDFNDAHDGPGRSHCQLTSTTSNAFGGTFDPCTVPDADASVDHIYGANLGWAAALVDTTVKARRVSDHPLVVATATMTATAYVTCAASGDPYNLGPVEPHLASLVQHLAVRFAIAHVGGYRADARDPEGHPSGLAADFMVPLNAAGQRQGSALAEYARVNATLLGVDYILWNQHIWSTTRAWEGWRPMRDRGSDTENHRDHVHINVLPTAQPPPEASPSTHACSDVTYPVPPDYVDRDRHNWHAVGPSWGAWHTGTDFSMPCGTPVYAANAGTVEIDTTQPWAGPYLVRITSGPLALATWYAHMESVTASRGQPVTAGDQIGTTGDLGNARGCHLHFEVHIQNGPIYGPDNVDPSTWLAAHARPAPSHPTRRRDARQDSGPDTGRVGGLHAGAAMRAIGGQEAHHAA